MDRLKILSTLALCIFLGCSNQDKGEKMREVKDLYGNTIGLDDKNQVIMKDYTYNFKTAFNSEITKIPISDKNFLESEKLRRTKQLLEVQSILSSSPYSSYTPSYLNPNDPRDRSYFLTWRDLYLKEPSKGSIAPWSKEEKEYYLSLKSKKERYIYLVKRSGLKCAIIDIPQEAIGNAKDFPEITELVEANRNTLKSDLHMGEWGICAGILGDPAGFAEGSAVGSVRSGFKARGRASSFLYFQLTGDLVGLYERYEFGGFNRGGVDERPLKASLTKPWVENPPVDEYGMIPFLDELIELDWIMDFSVYDTFGNVVSDLNKQVQAGKLLDPREARSTKESREQFRVKAKFLSKRRAEASAFDFPYGEDWNNNDIELAEDTVRLASKIMAVTPPQGYINAPYYYFPEELDELFEAGKLDRKLDPTIPAYKRVGFPQELVKRIEKFKEEK